MSAADKIITDTNGLLEELAAIVTKLEGLQTQRTEAHHGVDAQYNRLTDPLAARRDEIIERVTQTFREQRDLFTGKTKSAFLRAATLSARTSPEAVEIIDEAAAMKYLRKMGWLGRFTRVGKRVIDKNALKADPDRARRIPGIRLKQVENLTIKLTKPPVEIKRELNPLRRVL